MKGSRNYRTWTGLALYLMAPVLFAQEIITPLSVVPRPDNPVPMLKAGTLNEVFLYDNAAQTLPVVDDFSVDRTRHLNAQHGDSNVHHSDTYYRIIVNNDSTPDMAFTTDEMLHYIIEVFPDSLAVTVDTIPPIVAIIRDLTVYPPTYQSMHVWHPYTLIDTVGSTSTDTLLTEPNLFQDSLLVYTVEADTRVYINPDNSPRPWILWEDDDAYVNNTFPVDPPTIGVATLDGMDRTGYPYDALNPNVNGAADKLTSVPINLNYPAGDSIYLSFFCQPIGRSGDNLAHAEDSLYLDLFAPQEQKWYRTWASPGDAAPDRFQQVMIPITDQKFLKQDFRMRFRNDATLGGMVDQWHIDYVRLDRNRAYGDTVLQDVAFVYQAAGLLNSYTSVPFAKFVQAPGSYMLPELSLEQRNNDIIDKFITWGYGVTSDCGWSATRSGYGSNIQDNAYTSFNSTHPVNTAPNPLVYDTDGCSDAAFYEMKFWTNATPDALAYNDTMRYVQEISNYYSYDDGSAEAGYSLNAAGAMQAYRFDTQGSDSLRALRIYFAPIFTYNPPPVNNPANGSFIITIWKSLSPEVIIHQNVSFSKPEYKRWGPDRFVEYELDSVIPVEGTFYVGWVQTNATQMNLGMDRNRNSQDKMYFRTELEWEVSGQQASWMIRPVMAAAVDPFAGVAEMEQPAASFTVYPNPAGDAFRISTDVVDAGSRVELLDPMGRTVRQWAANSGSWSVSDVAPGLYIVRLVGRSGETMGQSRLIIQR